MTRRTIQTPKAPKAIGPYSQAIAAGGAVCCPDRSASTPQAASWCAGGIEAEARRAFANLAAVAEAAGAGLGAAVKVTIYLVDFGHFAVVNKIMQEFFSEPYPSARHDCRCRAAARRRDRGRLHPRAVTIERRPVTELKGVGPALARRLGKLGIETVADLLFWLPTRYEDRTHVVPIGSLRPGMRAAVTGTVELAEVVFRGRRSLLVRLADGTGFLTLRFFHFSGAQQQQLIRGARLACFGEVRRGKHGPEIVHPEYRDAGAPDTQAVKGALTPIYPATEGIQQGRLRNLTAQALAAAGSGELADFLPPEVQRDLGLPASSRRCTTCIARRQMPSCRCSTPANIPRSGASPSRSCSRTSSRCASCAMRSAVIPPGRSPRAASWRIACSRAPASGSRPRSGA